MMFSNLSFLVLFYILSMPQLTSIEQKFGCRQLIVVINKNLKATTANLSFYEWQNNQWKLKKGPLKAVFGYNGLAYADNMLPAEILPQATKKEGDGCSPAGLFALTGFYGYNPAKFKMNYLQVNRQTFCVDDAQSAYYNQIVHPDTVKQDWKSAETMRLKNSDQYKYGIFVAYNTLNTQPGKGSCIFMHIWGSNKTPTSGCTATTEDNLLALMNVIDPQKNPMLLQLTEADYRKLKNKYLLP